MNRAEFIKMVVFCFIPPVELVMGDGVSNYDPVLISRIRRSMPNQVAHDICSVQPMTSPKRMPKRM